MSKVKEYTTSEVTITWEPQKCVHSGVCVKGLPNVFQPKERPWIKIENATTDELVNRIKKCPSGALGYYMNDGNDKSAQSMHAKVEVMENGPLIVFGTLKVMHKNGEQETKNRTTAFCRCGASSNKPYCDGAHVDAGFED